MCCRRWPTLQRQKNYSFSVVSILDISNDAFVAKRFFLWTEKSFGETSTESRTALYGFQHQSNGIYPKYLIGAIWNRMRNVVVATCAIYRPNNTNNSNNNNKNLKHSFTHKRFLSGQFTVIINITMWKKFLMIGSHSSAHNISIKIGSKSNQPAACIVYFRLLSIAHDAGLVPPSIYM